MAEKRKDNKGRILRDNEYQQTDGRYFFCYYDIRGKRCREYSWKLVSTDKVPTGKRDCVSLREKEQSFAQDKFSGIDRTQAKKLTLNDIFDRYINSKIELKLSTKNNYVYMYRTYVKNTIGIKKISDLKYSDIKSFYNELINNNGISPNSVGIVHTILHPVFDMAVRDDLISKNPTDGIMSQIKKSHNCDEGKRHALTESQQSAFITFVAESPIYNHWLNLFAVFLGTGMRVGELVGLRWKDCDFKNRTININHTMIYKADETGKCSFSVTTPKTKSGERTIPMLNDVYNALSKERICSMQKGWSTDKIVDEKGNVYDNFVFLNKNRKVINPQLINCAIRRICKAYNEQERAQAQKERREPVILPRFSCHSLRHTFCTRFCENETNLKIIQEIMGHADISTTMNIYAEATESKKREVFNNLEGRIKIC